MEYLTIVHSLIIGIIAVAVRFWSNTLGVYESPDTRVYLAMSRGTLLRNPYRLRWLLPKILPPREWVWWGVSMTALVISCPLMAMFAESAGVPGIWAVLLWVSLPVWNVNIKLGMLVDSVAWMLALLAVVLSVHGYSFGAILSAMVAGMVAPKAPVFAALWVLNPWLLLGLVPVGIGQLLLPRGRALCDEPVLNEPWKTGMRYHGKHIHDVKELLLPWGGCMAAVFCGDWRVIPAVVVAYAQLLISTDSARLYMWAAPVVVVAALKMIPEPLLIIAVLMTWFNPFRSES